MIFLRAMVKLKNSVSSKKDDILQPPKFDHDSKCSNHSTDVGYYLNVFNIQYQKVSSAAQLIKVEFNIVDWFLLM